MKRLLTALFAVMASVVAMAQTPDNDQLFEAINSSSSPYYYPNLMLRYQAGEALSEAEYHHLYYGYAFQQEYKPLETNSALNRVENIMAIITIDTPSVADIDALIAACNEAMQRDPFSPKLLNILAYAYGTSGDKQREEAYYRHLNGVLKCIESSGSGLKEREPMHIIMFSHGLDYIASKGWNYQKGRIISRSVEYVPFERAHNKVKGYYFDYSRIYWNKPEGYTFKRERTWQFNNLPPRQYK